MGMKHFTVIKGHLETNPKIMAIGFVCSTRALSLLCATVQRTPPYLHKREE